MSNDSASSSSSSSSGCSVCTHMGVLPLLLAAGTSTTACGLHPEHEVCWHLGLLIRAVAVVWRGCCVEWSGVDVGVI